VSTGPPAPGIPPWQQYLLAVVRGEHRGAGPALIRALLGGAAAGYRAALESYLLCCRLGLLAVARAGVPVVSVGNLTVGGTGKTSAVMAIARQLAGAGLAPGVLSRGYGGGQGGIVSDGKQVLMPAAQSGDEPWLLAGQLPGVPVVVGKDRRRSAALAVGLGARSLVLDDGFQYWRLHKDLEVVLVDALNPFDNGRVLPAGLLREPIGHLYRAHAVWVTHADLVPEAVRGRIAQTVRQVQPALEVGFTWHQPQRLHTFGAGETLEPGTLAGRRVLALSSIGNPLAFERTLQGLGAQPVPARFPDHHRYRPTDLEAVAAQAGQVGAELVVTTEKDAVRLPAWPGPLPLWVLGVEMMSLAGGPPLLSEGLLGSMR